MYDRYLEKRKKNNILKVDNVYFINEKTARNYEKGKYFFINKNSWKLFKKIKWESIKKIKGDKTFD